MFQKEVSGMIPKMRRRIGEMNGVTEEEEEEDKSPKPLFCWVLGFIIFKKIIYIK